MPVKWRNVFSGHPYILGIVVVMFAASGLTVVLGIKNGFKEPGNDNLFSLVSSLDATTDTTLAHTQKLSVQVGQVEGELGELTAQEKLLTDQIQAGTQLQNQLTLQKTLTENGVSLMGQILKREQKTEGFVVQVGDKAGKLSEETGKSESTLSALVGSMQDADQEATGLNGQLSALLNELSISENDFKFFGQIDKLLSGILGGGTGNQGASDLRGFPGSGFLSGIAGTEQNATGVVSGLLH